MGRRQRLQAETRSAHRRLDGVVLGAVAQGREGYADYLAAAWAARGRLEALTLVEGSPVAGFIVPVRDDLALDLSEAAGEHLAQAVNAPRPAAPANPGEAGLWGIGYVLAGSCLGAAHLMRHVAAFGITSSFGARHLARQMNATAHWPRFVEALEGLQFTPTQEAECLTAADAAFAAFRTALAERGRA